MTLHRTFLALCATLVLAGCGGASNTGSAGSKFPDGDRESFLAGCEDQGGTVASCACVLTAVEQRWSHDDFKVIIDQMMAGGPPPAELARLSAGCAQSA